MLELYARAGVDFTLWFWAPSALSAVPTLAVRLPSGTVEPQFTAVASAATLSAGVAADRKTLTVNAMGGSIDGIAGDRGGAATLLTDAGGPVPVRVRAVNSSTSVVLAEPLPPGVTVASGDSLRWTTYYATATSLAITGTALARPVPFTVSYSADNGGSLPTSDGAVEGLLYVVRQPFATGVDETALLQVVPGLAGMVPGRQNSWQPQIETALRHLRTWIRRDLQARALNEHAVAGAAFREVHAFLAAWLVLQGGNALTGARTEQRDNYLETAKTLYADIRSAWPWVDLDGDGVVDDGEAGYRSSIGTSAFASLFNGDSDFDADGDDAPVFTRRMRH